MLGSDRLLPALLAGGCGGDGTSQETFPLCADDPGPAPLRRITRFEYGRTISDLTGVPASVADQLPPDEETLGFDDIADAYSVSSLHAAALSRRRRAGGDDADGERRPADRGRGLRSRRRATPPASPASSPASAAAPGAARWTPTSWRRCSSSTPTPPIRARPTASRASSRRCCSRRSSSTGPSRDRRAATGGHTAGAVRAGDAAVVAADRRRPGRRAAGRRRRPAALDTEDGLLARDRSPAGGPARGRAVRPRRARSGGSWAACRRSTRTAASTAPGRTRRRPRSPRRRACSSTDAWQGTPNLTTLLTAPVTFVDADLAAFYGLPAPARRRLPARRPRSRRAPPAC